MSLENGDTIDWLGIEKGSGRLMLTIIDDLDWSNEIRHVQLLQEKLNAYLAAIETGEAFDLLGEKTNVHAIPRKGASISVLAKYALPQLGREFLKHVSHVTRDAGVNFTHKVVAEEK